MELTIIQRTRRLADAILRWVSAWHPAKLAGLGYATYVLAGWLALCIPWVQGEGVRVSALDGLFIAVSAVSTTGLVPIDIAASYNFVGELIVLILIQFGGLGYMTFGSFVILSSRSGLSPSRVGVGKTVFSLPESFRIDQFIYSVMIFTFGIEILGAAALYPALVSAGAPTPLWSAVFHSVSAFCTAGFSLYSTSFEAYAGNFWLNAVISVLSILGAIGFIVLVDYWRLLTGKSRSITLTSKIIVASSLWLLAAGTAMIFLTEPTIADQPVEVRLTAAFFQSMTAMTTVGFNTVPIGAMSKASLLILVVLMIIGASPSGTGGGVKSTTASAIFGVMRSALRGEREVRFWGQPVPMARVLTAVASLGFYLVMLVLGTYLLELTQKADFEQNLFEAASALGTVGLSMGLTSQLTSLGKIIVITLMFTGRLGPLTFGMALFFRPPDEPATSDNDLAV